MASSVVTVTMTIPDDLSYELRSSFPNVGRAALEALAASAYSHDVLSLAQVRRLLDLPSRWEAQSLLSKHGVWPGTTVDDVQSDLDTLEKLRACD